MEQKNAQSSPDKIKPRPFAHIYYNEHFVYDLYIANQLVFINTFSVMLFLSIYHFAALNSNLIPGRNFYCTIY